MKLSLKIKMGSDGNFAAVSEEPQATVDPEVRWELGRRAGAGRTAGTETGAGTEAWTETGAGTGAGTGGWGGDWGAAPCAGAPAHHHPTCYG